MSASAKGYHTMLSDVEQAGVLPALLHGLSIRGIEATNSLAALWRPWPLQMGKVAIAALSLPALDVLLGDITPASLHPAIPARVVRSRQLSFLAGRLCAEQALASLHMHGAVVGCDAAGMPRWPDGVTGAITHSPDLAAAVVAFSAEPGELGLDCEPLATGDQLDSILAVCCTAADRAYLPREALSAVATLIFSAKEAGYKAMSYRLGRVVDFTEFEVCLLERDAGRLWLAPASRSEWQHRVQPFEVNFAFAAGSVYTSVDLRGRGWWTP
ncbi:4'-phosphopantetheinyl transferase superfamily protein [Crenobacter sp. SG2305]|uniref:4'-phosphopantetheinyl transferase family protein n=1 Tax=Crenobacter oryzisoli TaxID=3056844 RepID=UPI0025AAE96A|nr:4'-phosphopantetheinyl transferase superfamily protein [Crenobacter sp. SG2305]MDN0084358.1 4'-phosphopantetheinyl transferase superfamily protein [Crenobacter sp. SG2305]